jgi:hypothetical protein
LAIAAIFIAGRTDWTFARCTWFAWANVLRADVKALQFAALLAIAKINNR